MKKQKWLGSGGQSEQIWMLSKRKASGKKYEDMDLVRPETDLCPNKMDVVALLLSLVSCHPEKVLRFPFEVMCTFYNP